MPRIAKEKKNNLKKGSNKKINEKQENIARKTKEDKFSFDEEIVIGLKRTEEPKIEKKQKTKKNSKKKQKAKESKTNNYEDNGIIIKSKYMSNYEDENIYNKNRPKNNNKRKAKRTYNR